MKNHSERLPLARTEQLIVKEVDDEVLVFDRKTDQAHCLNKTAAQVWKKCDGEKSVAEISAILTNDGEEINEAVVWFAMDQLDKFNLLARIPAPPPVFIGMTRRQLVRSIGLAAIALPTVMSIAAPPAASAASKLGPNACCVNNGDCQSNNCNPCACPSCPSGKRCA